MEKRYEHTELVRVASALIRKAGIADSQVQLIAETLTEADLMGHSTHGLALLPAYLQEIENGTMKKQGEPRIVNESESAVVWDGEYINGLYLTRLAVAEALSRSADQPVVTYVIRRAHHIGCLAAYMPEIIAENRVGILLASDPAAKLVAPFGGTEPLYSPNPIAAGIPAGPAGSIILDISTSVTAAGRVNRHKQEGKPLPGEWLLTKDGKPTDGSDALMNGGSILPLGGTEVGYKGFALGLLIEALTSGLAGHGRADEPENWGTSVYLQVINPDAFSGANALKHEMEWLTSACRNSRTHSGAEQVRIPGDRALALRGKQLKEGVALDSHIAEALQQLCEDYNIPFPQA